MSGFRFGVSVFINLIMTVSGGFLLYLGSVGFVMTLQLYLSLKVEVPAVEGALNDTMVVANDGWIDLFADATLWLIMVGQVLIGVPLLIFGVLGVVRRLQAG